MRAVLLSLIFAGCTAAGEVHDVMLDHLDAIGRGDVDATVALFDPDVVLHPPGQPPVTGRMAARGMLTELLSQMKVRERAIVDEIVVGDGWAYEAGRLFVELRTKDGDLIENDRGKYLFVSRRRADGVWRLSRLAWNSDTELSDGESARDPRLWTGDEEVRGVMAALVDADNLHDLDAVMAQYGEDPVVMRPGAEMVEGRPAVREFYRTAFESFTAAIELHPEESIDAGAFAFELGRLTGSVQFRESGEAVDFSHTYLAVMKRDAGGRLKIARVLWS